MGLAKVYLVFYNIAQSIGWTVVFLSTIGGLLHGASYHDAFWNGASPAGWHQFFSCLEILHAATGIVPSSPVSNFWQWLGRSNALFVFAMRIPELQDQIWPVVMLLVWSFGEMIRYPWYAATLLDDCPPWLTRLRYTAFIPLYAIGVIAEMVMLYRGIPYVRERSIYSISMPNSWNFSWDHALFVSVMLVLYPYLWWQNYSSLLRQRKRKLSPDAGRAAGADSTAPSAHAAKHD